MWPCPPGLGEGGGTRGAVPTGATSHGRLSPGTSLLLCLFQNLYRLSTDDDYPAQKELMIVLFVWLR